MVSVAAETWHGKLVRPVTLEDFPAISSEMAALLRLTRDPRLAAWLSDSFALEVRSVRNLRKALPSGGMLVLDLRCPDGVITVGVANDLLPALALAVDMQNSGGPAIATLVGSSLLSPWLDRFGAAAAEADDGRWQAMDVAGIRLLGAGGDVPVPVPLVAWDVTLASQLHTRIAVLAIDPECIASLQTLAQLSPVRQFQRMRSWRIVTMLRIATRAWSVLLLRSLEVGDVLLCGSGMPIDAVDAELFCGAISGRHLLVRVCINQQKVTLMSEIQEQDGSNDEDEGESLPPALANTVAELEVPVHFELDSAALSLAQLASLRPGYVIELSLPVADAEIRLVACGQVIGRGRLVVIGDCLGVQLEQLETGSM